MPRPLPPDGSWTDEHHRLTFYISDELLAWIEDEMRRTGMSKTQVIVEALEARRHAQGRRKPR